jgi:hypothetical protein
VATGEVTAVGELQGHLDRHVGAIGGRENAGEPSGTRHRRR